MSTVPVEFDPKFGKKVVRKPVQTKAFGDRRGRRFVKPSTLLFGLLIIGWAALYFGGRV